jgi:hypothetical protein
MILNLSPNLSILAEGDYTINLAITQGLFELRPTPPAENFEFVIIEL